MLNLEHVDVSINDKEILHDFSYTFEDDTVYAVMGPNGSGKSTLAYTAMGHPMYTLSPRSKIVFDGEDITEKEANERADAGIFLSFQNPLALAGVRVFQFMQLAMKGKADALAIRQKVQAVAKELQLKEELLSRSLNDGASGGERKKMEVLQASVLDKKLMIFDEVDTGVDVDALKTISQYLHSHKKGKTYIVITHYTRILHLLKPDKVLVIANGRLQKEGDYSLAEQIEKEGYEGLVKQ